jgi:hypothetical protein
VNLSVRVAFTVRPRPPSPPMPHRVLFASAPSPDGAEAFLDHRRMTVLLERIASNDGLCPGAVGSKPMADADIVYHLRQASTLTRYARLTRNRERAAELLQLAEQHKKLALERKASAGGRPSFSMNLREGS